MVWSWHLCCEGRHPLCVKLVPMLLRTAPIVCEDGAHFVKDGAYIILISREICFSWRKCILFLLEGGF